METIFLNANNLVATNPNNNTLRYRFQTTTNFKNAKVALLKANLYYSWFNLNKELYNNASFQYTWVDENGDFDTTYTVNIPNGYYSLSLLNEYFQSQMIANKTYMTTILNNVTSNVFFIELITNEVKYAHEIRVYKLKTSAETNFQKPIGATWNLPNVGRTPAVIVNSTNTFGKLIGFNAGVYPDSPQTTNWSMIGQKTPEIDPISSIVVTCSCVAQKYSYPNTILYSFTNTASSFGAQISETPSVLSWCPIADGSYTLIDLTILDQNLQTIAIKDPQISFLLVIDESISQAAALIKPTIDA
jgi:hypothetical protein